MRVALTLVLALMASTAQADIRVVAPGFIYNSALKELAADFTRKTGVKVDVVEIGMNVIVNQSTHWAQLITVLAVMLTISGLLLAWARRQGWW